MKKRLQIHITGTVQGVGFRPTVCRYARNLGLAGNVRNDAKGVTIEAEGPPEELAEFEHNIQTFPPPHAHIQDFSSKEIPVQGTATFEIEKSTAQGPPEFSVPPDLAVCQSCINELFDPEDRRFQYPFINCTDCGPRFTIIRSLPYDRPTTSMAEFEMCATCHSEYANQVARRFDAQPNACPDCGPSLQFIPFDGEAPVNPVQNAAKTLREGKIGIIKGLGGYHLACSARNPESIKRLRRKKSRPSKALAVMFRNMDEIKAFCHVNASDERLLRSAAAPIVILQKRSDFTLDANVSPETADVGAFLPYTPLHRLLLEEVSPLVMTSANRREEPIAKTWDEAKHLLEEETDFCLDHNRPIVRRADDSVLRTVNGRRLFLRRSRGYVPRPLPLPHDAPSILGCGADLKNVFCLTRGDQAILSQYMGDLGEAPTLRAYEESIQDFCNLYQIHPEIIVHDLHPDYVSTAYAEQQDAPQRLGVQHHHAHIAAHMAEWNIREPAIGIALDGSGYGTDGTLWGGEFLWCNISDFRRIAHFPRFPMPGGEAAVKDPARMALSLLFTELGESAVRGDRMLQHVLQGDSIDTFLKMLRQGKNVPLTSSAGRVFDAVSALLGRCSSVDYEGQAAIRLESAAQGVTGEIQGYPIPLVKTREGWSVAFVEMLKAVCRERDEGVHTARIAARFHHGLARAVVEMSRTLASEYMIPRIVLSGGVFQNTYLLRLVRQGLQENGLPVIGVDSELPPNDGCIAYGQAAIASARQSDTRYKK